MSWHWYFMGGGGTVRRILQTCSRGQMCINRSWAGPGWKSGWDPVMKDRFVGPCEILPLKPAGNNTLCGEGSETLQ